MAAYQTFTLTRLTVPDPVGLLSAVRIASGDPGANVQYVPDSRTITVKKVDAFTPSQIAATQAALETCPDLTPQRHAQNEIDQWPLSMKAFALALVDQLNVLRVANGMQAVTPAQALAAIRQKAGTL